MIHNHSYLLITVITLDKTLVSDIREASQIEVAHVTNHEKSKVVNPRQKIVIIDYNSVPVIKDKLKEWAENSQFLILLLVDKQSELIDEYEEYIADVWHKPIKPIILAKRLSMLTLFSSTAKDVSEYVGILSFEIKNPIASIQGYSNILLSGKYLEPLTKKQNEFVSVINSNASRMRYLADNMNYNFQIKYGVFTFAFNKIDIDALLKFITEKIDPSSNSEEPLYHFELIKEENLPKIYADEYRIIQAIEIILIGAKHEKSTRIKFIISKENDYIKFSISSEKQFVSRHPNGFYISNIFLGENILAHIIDKHNGEIYIESNHGADTIFSFTIPIVNKSEV